MQTVSQSYSSQVYIQMQNGFSSPVNRREADSTLPSNSQSSQQSTDDPISLSAEGRQRSQERMNTSPSEDGAKQGPNEAGKTGEVGSQTFSEEEVSIAHGKTDGTQENKGFENSNETNSQQSNSSPQIPNFSRRLMTSAYQAIAEITS